MRAECHGGTSGELVRPKILATKVANNNSNQGGVGSEESGEESLEEREDNEEGRETGVKGNGDEEKEATGTEDEDRKRGRGKEGRPVWSEERWIEELECQPCGRGDTWLDDLSPGEAAEEGAGRSTEEEGEEARESKGLVAPKLVSKQEREEHERTHMPFRNWCPYCVKGRARKMAHRRKVKDEEDKEVEVPRISMDYHYMSKEDEEAKVNPMLIVVPGSLVGQLDHPFEILVEDSVRRKRALGVGRIGPIRGVMLTHRI